MKELTHHNLWGFVKVLSLYLLIGIGIFSVLFSSIPAASAEPTYTINYQGKLTNSSGLAVADGTYNMRFWLLQSQGQATTSAVWTESRTGGNKVTVENGLFSVQLGSVTSLASINFNQTLYLGVEIGGSGAAAWDGEMSPRKVIGTVPSAFEAKQLGGVASTSFLRSDQADSASGLLSFTGGFISSASSTATRFNFTNATGTSLYIGGDRITDFVGDGLTLSGTTLQASLGGSITAAEIANGDHGFFTYASGVASLDTGGLTSANLSDALTNETGTGVAAFSASPTFTGTLNASAATFASTFTLSSLNNANSILFTNASGVVTQDATNFLWNDTNNQLTLNDGSATSPTYSFSSATGTGMYRTSNGRINFAVAGVQSLQILGSGAAYISSGKSRFLSGTAASPTYGFENDTTTGVYGGSGGLGVSISGTSALFVDTSRNVGIGTTSPWKRFSVSGDMVLTGALYDSLSSAGTNGKVLISTGSATTWVATSTLGINGTADDLSNNSIEDLNDVAAMTENFGDLLYWNGSAWADLATSSLNVALANTTGTLGVTRGGTGLTSASTGDLLYASSANTLANRTIGTTGQVLQVVGGLPTWVATSSLGIAVSEAVVEGYIFDGDNAGTLSSGTLALDSLSYSGTIDDANVNDALTITGGTLGSNSISSGATWATGGTLTIGDGGDRIDISSNTWDVTNGVFTDVTSFNGLVITANTGVITTGTWQAGVISSTYLDTATILSTEIDTSAELAGILTDETGTGRAVFSISPAFSGTPTFAALSATSTVTLSGTAANIALGSNFISNGGADEGISVGASGNVTISGTLGVTGGLTIDASTETNIEAAIDTLGNLTSVGTIGTGIWQGTDVGVAYGGTGLSTFGGTNRVLYTSAADALTSEAAFTYDQSTDTLTSTNLSIGTTLSFSGVGAINGLDSIDATSEATIETQIFDADAKNITGVWEVADDIDFVFGTDADWAIQYDEGVDNQLLFITAATAAIATTDPMVEFLVGTTPTANQQVFGVAKGTQVTNTALFTIDAEGDALINGTIGTTGGLTIDATTETNIEAAIDTLANLTSASSLVTVGTITSGTWTAGVISSTYLDTGVLLATELDTCAEFAALGTVETGTCGSLVLSVSPAITGTLDVEASDFSGLLTMSGSAANIALGSNYLSGDGGDEGIYIDSNGNVGVASTTPWQELSVTGDVAYTGTIYGANTDFTGTANFGGAAYISSVGYARMEDGLVGSPSYSFENDANTGFWIPLGDTLALATGGTERFRVNASGNFGLGTTTPNQALSIFRSAADAAIEFSTVSGTAEKWTVGIDDSDGAKFKISSSSALGTNDRLTIDGNGYIGIGDSTPTALLSVGSGDLFTVNTSGVISSSNNLTPNAVFSTGQADEECLTYEATGTTFEWQTCGTGYLASTDIDTSSELDTIVGDNTGSGALVFGTSPTFTTYANFGSAGVRLSDDGDGGLTFLGLGNGNDEDLKLDLDNTANTGVFTSSTGLAQLTFTGIGINTTSGTGYSLFGTKYFYASTTNDSISIGENAGRLYNGGALYNVALGFEAGYTATSSDYNTYIGYRSGYAGTSASTNVAIGYEALLTSTSSSGNVAIGYRALRSLNGSGANGAGLVAIGYEALTSNTSGHLNVAIGQAALRSNTSGSQNLGIGYGAGYWNTTGFDNIFIGQETGSGVVAGSTGSNNTAVGRLAMTGYSSGAGNSAFGRSALGNNKTGSNNTTLGYLASTYNGSATNTVSVGAYAAYGSGVSYSNQGSTVVGFQSGYSFQTGSHYNTLIGYNAGYNVTTGTYNTMLGYFGTTGGVSGGSNNILIGQDVRSGLTVTASNQLNIGNLLFGTGLGSGTTLSTGNIGIGTSTPNQKLGIFAAGADSAIEFSTVSGTAEKWTIGIDDSDAAKFKISSSSALGTNDRFVINGNGYVGIGDSTPTALLTVGTADNFTVNASGVITSSDNLTPNSVETTGQVDEYCLTFETGGTFEWQTCSSGGGLASTDIDTSAELAGILTDETGTGRAVFSISPAFSGTPTFAALSATSTVTLSGTAANIALGSNFISNGGADEGISVGASGNVTISGTLGVTGGLTIDATTETNIESAIDTLANLTSASALATVGTITSGTWQGTVIDITRGGLGAAFTDPNADQLMFWDDSLGAITGISTITGGSISGTTLTIAVSTSEITDDTITFADINMTAAIGSDPAFAVNDTFFGSTGIIFEGGTADAFEGLLTSAVATSDKTWTLPNTTGTLITNGDTGTVTNTMLAGSIAASKLVGTDIVTVGTITSGTWTAGVISSTYLDTGVLLATELDTCAEFAALGTIETGTCGSLVLSVSPAITGTLDVEASDFSGLLTMSGSAANIVLGSNYLSGDGGDEGVFVDASGNVGIGMDAVYKFDVDGFINTSQYGGYKQAGNTILYASSTNNSMFAGIGAGASFVASSSNRFSNAFGRLTLSSASMSGSFNNGFGYGALLANTTGLANNAFGHAALDSVTIGTYNTGVGHTVLQNITTTSFNTAIGSFSQYLATANNNTSIGYQSLYRATGDNNVAVGFQALDSLTASGGTTNTAIGYAAGDTLYGSTKNTFLGSNADVITNSSSTITNSTAVGADVTLYNSNTVILGNGADVGIGTSTPNQRLTIFKSAADAAIEFSTVSGANEKWTIGVDDSDAAKFKISSSSALGTNDRFVIDGGGKVGIGTASPNRKLTIDDATAPYIGLSRGGTAHLVIGSDGTAAFLQTQNNMPLSFYNDSNEVARITDAGLFSMIGSAANIALGSNYLSGDGADEGIYVDASGNVTIGKTTPVTNSKLDANGRLVAGVGATTNAALTSSAAEFWLSSNSLITIGESSAGSANGALTFYRTAAGSANGGAVRLFQPTSVGGVLRFQYSPSGSTNYGSETYYNAMQIASDKVSIGTTSSNAMLSVHGTSTATILQVYTTGGATTYTMDNVGEVSIGSDQTPENLLDIHSASAQAALAITSLGTDTDALIKFELADNTATFAMGVDDSDSDKFKISTTALGTNDRLTIDSSGNVGIGTNDPAGLSAFFAVRKDQDAATIQKIWNGTTGASAEARLDLVVATANAYVINTVKDNSGSPFYQIAAGSGIVNSYFNMPAYNFQNVAGTNWLNIDTAGEVGIGDTTPDDLLNIYSAAGQAALAITSAGTDTDALIKYELTDGTALFTTGIDDSDGDKFKISGSALGTSDYLVISGGDIGIGVSDPDKRLEVFETVADSQFKLSYDATSYAQFQTSSAGDLTIDASGGDVNVLDENFWVCSGGACPSGTPTGNGNLIVERGIGVATSTPITGISVGADSAIVTTEKNVADAGTITIDWNQGNQQLIRLAASRTVNFSNVKVGQTLRLVVCRTAGSYTATWGSTIRWGGGAAPTQTTTSNKCDVFSFIGTLSDTGSAVIIFGSSSLNF